MLPSGLHLSRLHSGEEAAAEEQCDLRPVIPRASTRRKAPHQAGFAPDHDPGEIFEIAKRLMKNM
jgi:hypothetical protein